MNSDIDNNIDNNNDGEEVDVEDQYNFGDNYGRVIFGSMGNIQIQVLESYCMI